MTAAMAGLSFGVCRASITPRQLEVLQLVAAGHGNKAIAERIGKSENDVKAIVSRLLTSLHAANRAELAQIAVRLDVIGESDLGEHEIHELLRESPVMTALVRGPDHRFVFVNHAYRRRAGDLDYLGKPVSELFPLSPAIVEQLDHVYATGEAQYSRAPVVIAAAPGRAARTVGIASVMTPVRDETGKVTGVAFFGLDLTDDAAWVEAPRRRPPSLHRCPQAVSGRS